MTISSTTNRKEYTGNGVTTAFAFPYPFEASTDLRVFERTIATGAIVEKTAGTHFTVTGAGDPSGGTVTATTAPANTVNWIIVRDPARTQGVALVNGEKIDVEASINDPLDALTLMVQRQNDRADRAIHAPDGDLAANANMELPDATTRASKILSFDVNGLPTVEDPMVTQTQAYRDEALAAVADAEKTAASAGADLWSRPVDSIESAEPGSPSIGDRVLLDDTNATRPNQVAEYFSDGWHYSGAPQAGQSVEVISAGARYRYTTTYGWQNAERSRWRSSEFDLVPDGGSADQHDALVAILAAASASDNPRDREIVLRGNGVVKIGTEINLDSYPNIRLICDKNLRLIPASDRQFLFKSGYSSSVSGLTNLAANALRGSYFVQVADTSGFTLGQYVWLQSDAVLPDVTNSGGGNSGTPLKCGQIARLLYKDSTKLYIDRALTYDYLTADSAQVGTAPIVGGWTFENLQWGSIADTATLSGNMLTLKWCSNVRVISPKVENSRTDLTTTGDNSASNGIAFNAALDVYIEDPQMKLIGYYGVEYDGPCNNIEIRGGQLSNCRHGFSANWDGMNGYGEPVDIRHYGTQIVNSSLSGVRNHDVGRQLYYNRVRSIGSLGDKGFLLEASYQTLDCCEGVRNANDGVIIPSGIVGTQISGGRYSDNSRSGINAQSVITVTAADISKNGLVNTQSGACGISTIGGIFRDCNIDDNKSNAIVYGPNVDGFTLAPLLISGGKITKTSNQTALVYQFDKSGYDTALVRITDVDLTGWNPSTDYFAAKGTSATTPAPTEPRHSGLVLSDESSGATTRGTATLVAGTVTVTTSKVFKFAGLTGGGGGAKAPFISKIRLQLRTAGGTPGNVRVSAVTDRTSFVITSDSASDTSTYDWWIEH